MTLRYAEGEGQAWQAGRGDELEALSQRLCDLVERDAAIYDKVAAARELPAGAARSGAMEKALREALETPLEMMEACLGALRIAVAGSALGVPQHLACDTLAGAQALWVALEDACLMVRENAGGVPVDQDSEALVAGAEAMRLEAARLLREVRGHAEAAGLSGKGGAR